MIRALHDIPILLKACRFAARAHQGQKRDGGAGEPYIVHPIAVAEILIREGSVMDAEILAAALLHDTIEDAPLPRRPEVISEIALEFGLGILNLVLEVTDSPAPREERRQAQLDKAPKLSRAAGCIKLADKLANMRDLAANRPWPVPHMQAYAGHALTLAKRVKDPNPWLFRLVVEQAAVLRDLDR
jgi:guanosine-3',5'-bis(diphosphate) 3'-pyrophosphohydrolase